MNFLVEDLSGSAVLDMLKALKGGSQDVDQERMAIIKAGEEERDNKLHASFLSETGVSNS